MFYFEKINGKTVMKSDLLNKADHFFTTRESIIKTKEKDMESQVQENKKMFCEIMNLKPENFINPSQTHSVNIEIADVSKNSYPDCDGLILTDKEQEFF